LNIVVPIEVGKEQRRGRLVSYQLQLATLLDSIDTAKMNVNMASTLKSAKDVLEQLNSGVAVDDIEEVMDDLNQLQRRQMRRVELLVTITTSDCGKLTTS